MAVGHEWDMRSEVHYLCHAEKCPDPPGFFLSISYRNKFQHGI